MQNTKTFRLFISSTFNDFRREREVLQTEVFPNIKEYCSKKGYVFQPIDLRWGLNEEAQLDQKTLEMCLDEVRSCKSYPYPNFLLMLGDRYGWVPLPYAIESQEFEEILTHTDAWERELLLEWYREDLNQLPASYILKERNGEYVNFTKWDEVENAIRDIFQSSVKKTTLTQEQQRKYFLSATEAEIEEGIIPYINPTVYQRNLLKENPELEKVDSEHIFGFSRDVAAESKKSDKFMGDDTEKAQSLKHRVKDELVDANILHTKTRQINEDDLDESYLKEFKQSIIAFLENKVDVQIAKEKNYTPLEMELQTQEYFAKQKRQNFVGQEEILAKIQEYIKDKSTSPCVIHGKSGRGKSSLMAKAIEEAEINSSKKVLYRFVGATPHSGTSKEILTSLFEELGINIRSQYKDETFEEFSNRVRHEILELKEEIVVFIDAIDQIGHDDQFLWLTNKLPTNVKIIISALNDKKYKYDSKYFKILKTKSTNLIEVQAFKIPLKLLYLLLRKENRTIQEYQERYFLERYKNVSSPLYIKIAIEEIKHWKSFDSIINNEKQNENVKSLSNTQQGIIEQFINNLYTLHYHEEELVKRVMGYIFASGDGLSESELLQLLSMDKEFVKKLAPETYHQNKDKNLPIVIWARLYAQLKPFLSIKEQDGEDLFYFFHRGFGSVIKRFKEYNKIHRRMIKQILDNIDEHTIFFNSVPGFMGKEKKILDSINVQINNEYYFPNRLLNLLYKCVIIYEALFKEKPSNFFQYLQTIDDEILLINFTRLFNNGKKSYKIWGNLLDNLPSETAIKREIYVNIYKIISEKFPQYLDNYFEILQDYSLIKIQKENNIQEGIAIQLEALKITDFFSSINYKKLPIISKSKPLFSNHDIPNTSWLEKHLRALNNLATSYEEIKDLQSVLLRKKYLDILLKNTPADIIAIMKGVNFLTLSLIINNTTNHIEFINEIRKTFLPLFDDLYLQIKPNQTEPIFNNLKHTKRAIVFYYLKFLNNLGELYFINNDLENALSIYNKQYRIARFVHGENDKNTIAVKNNIKLVQASIN